MKSIKTILLTVLCALPALLSADNISIENDQKFLCSESCKGLCVVCGTNLNVSECDCDTEEIDPRLEMFKKLLNKYD